MEMCFCRIPQVADAVQTQVLEDDEEPDVTVGVRTQQPGTGHRPLTLLPWHHCQLPLTLSRFLFSQVLGRVNRRENWKTWERRGENLDYQ